MKSNNIICLLALTALFSLNSCDNKLAEEITELQLSRALSPTNVVAQVVERTSVRLNWKKSFNAELYNIELFDNPEGTGTAVKRIENIGINQLPYTIVGLDGETDYLVKIQGVSTDIAESTWSSATFKTGTEQILNNVNPEEITSSSVILRWPAGLIATNVILTPGDKTVPVNAADIANGSITIDGLISDVNYTAKLMNGVKTRGTISFTTLLGENVTKITPNDNFSAILASLQDGDIVALEPGTYNVNADLDFTKIITIQGYKPADKPIIKGLVIKVKGGAGLTLKDVVLDGTGNSSQNQTIIYDEDKETPYGDLTVENSEIKNYVKGLVYMNRKTRVSKVTLQNNLLYNIECNGGDFFDLRNGIIDELFFKENTVYNSALARDFFRMDAGGSTNFPSITAKLYIEKNIFYKITNGNNRRLLYIRLASHQIHFNKNIVAESAGIHTNQASTTLTEMKENNYFNAPTFTSGTVSNAKYDIGNYTILDPQFVNAAQGDFTIGNLDLKLNEIGPARWR